MVDLRLTEDQFYKITVDTMKYEYGLMKDESIKIMQSDKIRVYEQENLADCQKYMAALLVTIQLFSIPKDFEEWMKNER